MNIALIMAGGVGERTHQDIPKQFLNVFDKPVIIYTLEAFQQHPDVDGIIVSCIEGWHDILRAYAKQFGITKLKWIVNGGENGQASARNGVYELENVCSDSDVVIIHDAIRPMVSADIISDCIVKATRYGSGLAAMRCQETIIRSTNGISGNENINRWE
ncbi:MAG: 2-C-methyl-D-erythritol 4-phosphate cytidylyltransferase, partial [Clostridiales bacterium]|nr:2-C-methyl-D-erythritol 4-phosphate cytidylyltransferase [Clostridiales bacterium]